MHSGTFKPTECPVVTHSSQIKDLPWKGNFASDSSIFNAIDAYVRLPNTPMDERKKALYGMSWYGMGINEEVTNATLVEYFELQRDEGFLPVDVVEKYINEILNP